MFKKLYRLNWLFLVVYAATTHAAPGSNNAGGLPQCNTDLGICQTANTQLQSSLTTCQATNSQLQTSLSSCQSTVTQLQDQFQQAQIVYANLQTAYGNCLTTNTQLQQQNQTDQAQITSLQTALNSCQATNAQLQQQLQAAQAQIAALQTGSGGSTPPPSTTNMPSGLTEYIEFSLLPSSVASDRYQSNKWDLTGTYTNIATGSNMTWDATLKAWKAPGGTGDWFVCGAADAIDTGWRPDTGPKTACMWKRYYVTPSGRTGVDGFQSGPGIYGQYFYYGTYGEVCPTGSYWLALASGNVTSHTACVSTPKQDEWAFYCIASGGNSSPQTYTYTSTQLYTAVPGDAVPVLRTEALNQFDTGFTTNPTGMRYGCLDTNQHGSRAYYGSMIHFNSKLTADQVNQVYQATKVYYPGHGGTR